MKTMARIGLAVALCAAICSPAMAGNLVLLEGERIILQNSVGDAIIDNNNSHIRYRDATTVKMVIRGNGKVGINNTNPQTELHVGGDTTSGSFIVDNGVANGGFFEFRSSGNETYRLSNASGLLRLVNVNDGEQVLGIDDTGDASFSNEVSVAVLEIRGEGNDLAEGFKVHGGDVAVKPGMVVTICPDKPGEMELSSRTYQRTVAGIISGAGNKHVGLQLGNADEVARGELKPVALTGQVWCHVDATTGAVAPGDLLTTSATPGHAMKVNDYARAQGAVLGKAMTPLAAGQRGLVLVLVTLQ